jgi:hypothetical protein
MAIKISGSTIIDDSRNIANAGIITATTSITVGSAFIKNNAVGLGTTNTDRKKCWYQYCCWDSYIQLIK